MVWHRNFYSFSKIPLDYGPFKKDFKAPSKKLLICSDPIYSNIQTTSSIEV